MIPKMLERLTMWASRWRESCGRNARVECTTPQKLMLISHSICAWSISVNWPSSATPALLTTMLRPGWRPLAACAKASISLGSPTSTRCTVTFREWVLAISAATACNPASSRSASARSQPRAASSSASIAAGFGCALGIVPHMSAAMLGLAAVLHTSALAFAALKWCGVIYLLYMAWQALRERGALAIEPRLDARSSRKVIVTGFLINILNPKLSIFFLAFLPQFIAADEGHPLLRMLELSGAFMAMTFAGFVVYGLFAAFVRDRIVTRPKAMTWLRRAFAGGLAALGAKLAVAER